MDGESEASRERRVKSLWASLDAKGTGKVDLEELRGGLKRINHPLRDADDIVKDVMRKVDRNGDGTIEYSEFVWFVKHAETELWKLFKSIDGDNDNKLDKAELRSAFAKAGISVPSSRLDAFFVKVDANRDGVITFDEWREFLLFLPADSPGLRAILSYFAATVKVNAEGDVLVSDDMIQGLGYFLSGGIAGIVSRTSTAPLDRLKVYLIAQTENNAASLNAAKAGAPLQATKHAGNTLVEASRALWRAGGVRSLWAGNGLNVAKVMPESAIKFGSYEASKRFVASLEGHGDPTQIKPWSQFVAGGLGGIISQFCVYPLDTLKFRMQCDTVEGGLRGNRLIFVTAQKMWNKGGFRSFYRGLPMGLIGMFPYSAIDLSTFEYLKRRITRRNARLRGCSLEDATPGPIATAAIGGFSGALGASLVYPLNLVRTRLQTQGTVQHPRTYTGIWDVTVQTVKGEGVRGLFKGLTPNLLKVVPAVSITYVVYESSKKALKLA